MATDRERRRETPLGLLPIGVSISSTDEQVKHEVVVSGELDLKKKSREWKQQIVLVNQHEFRGLFGVRSADKWGSFVDCNLSAIVHSYADWARYPRGKHTVLEGRNWTAVSVEAVIPSDGYHLFIAHWDGHIAVWDLTVNREIGAWKAHEEEVRCLDYHGSGMLVSGSDDKSVRIWNGHTAALIHNLEGHTDRINSVAFSEDGSRVVSGSSDNSICLWSMKTGECLRQFLGRSESVTNVRLIGEVIISGAHDGYLKLWRLSESEAFKSISVEGDEIQDISVNCDHSLVGLICDYELIVYSWPKMNKIHRIYEETHHCCFHPFNPHLFAVNIVNELEEYTDTIQMYDARTGKRVRQSREYSELLSDLRFTPDGTRLVGTHENVIEVWELPL